MEEKRVVNRIVGGGLAALFFALVVAALTVFGVISMTLGHIFMTAAGVIGALLICTEIIPGKRAKHKAIFTLMLWALLGLSDYAIIRHKDAEHATVVSSASQPIIERPHVDAHLVIDSDTKESTRLSLVVSNGGVTLGSIRRAASDTQGSIEFDGDIVYASQLLPHATMEITGPLLLSRKPETTLLIVLTYQALVDGNLGSYHSEFRFAIPPVANLSRPIFPTDIEEGSGDADYEQIIRTAMQLALSRSAGTIEVAIPEKRPDGSPNDFSLSSPERDLLSSPITGRVMFVTGLHGKNRTIDQSFQTGVQDMHVVSITWDDSRKSASLMVDGKIETGDKAR